jgi:site-specific DNA-methyltransferase (adenine-specific)
MGISIRMAGFEIRDSIGWVYGSGFPKSLDVSKAIDKAAGAEREVIGKSTRHGGGATPLSNQGGSGYADNGKPDITAPSTPQAQQWQGWGTALKPALEPIVVARKPLIGTVAENVLTHGTGGLNIDGSRIGTEQTITAPRGKREGTNLAGGSFGGAQGGYNYSDDFDPRVNTGRWPANLILDEYTAELLDEQSGQTASKQALMNSGPKSEGWGLHNREPGIRGHNDSGGASRFFYVAKASKRDRNEGLEDLATKANSGSYHFREDGSLDGKPTEPRQNFHPTVKPTELMRYLVKLITPPGGTVLDPFTGSGSTGKAAILEGFDFIGIELTEDYWPIIEGRLKHAEAKVAEAKEKIEAQPQGLF